MRADNREMHSP